MKKTLFDYCAQQQDFSLLGQWHCEKNGKLSAQDVSYGSHKIVWWQCNFGHLWSAPVYSRTLSRSGCPYCAGKKVLPSAKNLLTAYPQLAKQWHPTKNAGLRPQDVSPSTHRKVWWICEEGHCWCAQINSRTAGAGCPVCANRTLLPGFNDLATTHPQLAAQWDPERNLPLTPKTVFSGSHKKAWWRCESGHSYLSSINRRAQGQGCPVCSGKQILPGENDLATSYPAIARQWHPDKNGALQPNHISAFSNQKVWWRCPRSHAYQAVIASRTRGASECPYCTNRKVLPGFNDLFSQAPKIAAQWHPELNGNLTPEMVTCGSRKKVWWQCSQGHIWKAVIYSRTGAGQCGCPVCAGNIKAAKLPAFQDR